MAIDMKLLWIKWSGDDETRDDGFTIYRDTRWTILKHPDGHLTKHSTPTEAKNKADEICKKNIG